ncbi:MAG TPA: hypothetical protein PKD63_02475 [Solirubrobacteraceae bacterium]|nr:hypothetical protein [Solirubrobacteraceae bacterium]
MASHTARTRTGLALLLAAAAIAALIPLTGLGTGLLFIAPAIVAVLLLAAGRFPGEQALAAARDRRRPRRLRAPRRAARPRAVSVLGRALSPVAACAAGRAPPAVA